MAIKKLKHSTPLSRKRTFLIALLVVLLAYAVILLLVSVFAISSPYNIKYVDYDFSIKEVYGLNVDVDGLHFGGGPPGTILERSIILTAEEESKVKIFWDGPGKLAVDKNNFIINSGENTSVFFKLIVPDDLPLGNYSGTVSFQFFK